MKRGTEQNLDWRKPFLERLRMGRSVRSISRDTDMPSSTTIWRHIRKHLDFKRMYVTACKARADRIFNEILEIADDASEDYRQDTNGNAQFKPENVRRALLMIDARKWTLSRMMQKNYGDDTLLEPIGAKEKGSLSELRSEINASCQQIVTSDNVKGNSQ